MTDHLPDHLPPIREQVDMTATRKVADEARRVIQSIDYKIIHSLSENEGPYLVIADNINPSGPARVIAVKTSDPMGALGALLLYEGARCYKRLGRDWTAYMELTHGSQPQPVHGDDKADRSDPDPDPDYDHKPRPQDVYNQAQDRKCRNGDNRS